MPVFTSPAKSLCPLAQSYLTVLPLFQVSVHLINLCLFFNFLILLSTGGSMVVATMQWQMQILYYDVNSLKVYHCANIHNTLVYEADMITVAIHDIIHLYCALSYCYMHNMQATSQLEIE